MKRLKSNFDIRSQRGAALIVSLAILALVTVLGVAGMQSTQLEMKMTSSARDRSEAFAAVEAAIKIIEQEIIADPPHLSQYATAPVCNGNDCFNENCDNGLCFVGSFDVDEPFSDCEVTSITRGTDFWADDGLDVWAEGSNKHLTQIISGNAPDGIGADQITVKYIQEFMCFTTLDETAERTDASGYASGGGTLQYIPLIRVTAFAEGRAGRAKVALQSMVRAARSNATSAASSATASTSSN